MDMNRTDNDNGARPGGKRRRLARPYPIHTLEDALAVANTIHTSNAGLPFDRLLLARAMGTTPTSSGFSMRLSSSAKYGITRGGYNDERINLTDLGEAISAPKGGEELRDALVDAALHPEIFAQFYGMVAGKRLPEDAHSQNMLQRDCGINPALTGECLKIIKANGILVGILRETGGAHYVAPERTPTRSAAGTDQAGPESAPIKSIRRLEPHDTPIAVPRPSGRIFIAHSGSGDAVQLVRSTLGDFGIPHDIVDGDASDSRPIPEEVSALMCECTAAIVVFPGSDDLMESDATKATDMMLVQVGAASALYGARVVAMREADSDPSFDLPGLRCVDYDRTNPERSSLALLRELHATGVISIAIQSQGGGRAG